MSFLKPEAPKTVDEGAEKAKLRDKREDLMMRSRFEENTKVAGSNLGSTSKTFRNVLGR